MKRYLLAPIKFAWALWTWARGGFALLPVEFIYMRHGVCKDCEHYRSGWFRDYCHRCKCTLSPRRHPFNKLAHPCEECPLMNWSKVWGYGCFPNEGLKEKGTE